MRTATARGFSGPVLRLKTEWPDWAWESFLVCQNTSWIHFPGVAAIDKNTKNTTIKRLGHHHQETRPLASMAYLGHASR